MAWWFWDYEECISPRKALVNFDHILELDEILGYLPPALKSDFAHTISFSMYKFLPLV